jgi:alpha-tubulin suppressor-like RCC1 family protein
MLFQTGFVSSFGTNDVCLIIYLNHKHGELGLGNNQSTPFPSNIQNLIHIRKVFTGLHFSMVLDYQGNVYSFGENDVKIHISLTFFSRLVNFVKDRKRISGFQKQFKNWGK